jgi:multicomponent Na+:H+ antiporter subunit A
MAYLLGHALYKAPSFSSPALDHETGTRDVDRLGGLGRAMPLTAAAAGAAALSMAGLPPLFGFVAKELSYEAALRAGDRVGHGRGRRRERPVGGRRRRDRPPAVPGQDRSHPQGLHEAPPGLWLGPVVLAGLGLAFGLWPGLGVERLVPAAFATAIGPAAAVIRSRRSRSTGG